MQRFKFSLLGCRRPTRTTITEGVLVEDNPPPDFYSDGTQLMYSCNTGFSSRVDLTTTCEFANNFMWSLDSATPPPVCLQGKFSNICVTVMQFCAVLRKSSQDHKSLSELLLTLIIVAKLYQAFDA